MFPNIVTVRCLQGQRVSLPLAVIQVATKCRSVLNLDQKATVLLLDSAPNSRSILEAKIILSSVGFRIMDYMPCERKSR